MTSDSNQTSATPIPRDSWYRELVIHFNDGNEEHFYIELTQTGTHIPRPLTEPAPWTRLSHYKCACCPLGTNIRYCPAAESLETTLLRLQDHYSTEQVKARAVDGASRETIISRSLQEVGTAFVHLAVFSSGCPIGREFRPMLSDLRPFSTNEELSRHIVTKMLLKHRGRLEQSRQQILAMLEPLREVFAKLCKRLPVNSKGDAMANSIISMDAAALAIVLEIDQALENLATEMGWGDTATPRPVETLSALPPTSLWARLKARFTRKG